MLVEQSIFSVSAFYETLR